MAEKISRNADKYLMGSEKTKEELVQFWQQNPVIAARDIYGEDVCDFDKPQQVYVNTVWKHDQVIGVMSRGTGKTFTSGATAGLAGLLYPGNRVGLIGPSFRQSKMLFREIEALWEASPLFQEATVRAPSWTPESCYIKFHAAPGRKASWIEALPLGTDGSKIRGARFYWLFGDEGAQIESDILDTVVFGFLATSGNPMKNVRELERQRKLIAAGLMEESELIKPKANKFILTSTAYYQYNHLWTRVQKFIQDILAQKRKHLKSGMSPEEVAKLIVCKGGALNEGQIPHRVMSDGTNALCAFTYKDMSEGFMSEKTIENARLTMSQYKFLMEYWAYFPPDSEGFFRRNLLDRQREHRRFSAVIDPQPGMIYVMGVDPARSSDNFSIAIFEIDPTRMSVNLVRVMAWNNKSFPYMHQEVRRLIRHYKIEYFKMDGGGGGTTIRDLLANDMNCPPGDSLILEHDNEDHKLLVGKKILGPLVNFSSAQWVEDANDNLLSGLQHNRLLIHAPFPVGSELTTAGAELNEKELADEEMEHALSEWSSIVQSLVGNRRHFDTPSSTQRKDRYSAILIGYDAALHVLGRLGKPRTLAMGGWGQIHAQR
jgi:hypothetical protein